MRPCGGRIRTDSAFAHALTNVFTWRPKHHFQPAQRRAWLESLTRTHAVRGGSSDQMRARASARRRPLARQVAFERASRLKHPGCPRSPSRSAAALPGALRVRPSLCTRQAATHVNVRARWTHSASGLVRNRKPATRNRNLMIGEPRADIAAASPALLISCRGSPASCCFPIPHFLLPEVRSLDENL
jgi:hypothetical protein